MRRTSEKPFGMHAGGGEAREHIARAMPARGAARRARRPRPQSRRGRSRPRRKAPASRRLAADERAAGLPAPLGDAAHDRDADLGRELRGGEIVEEKQGLGALDHDVVHAHRDEIDADGVMDAGLDRDLDLGPDAVIGATRIGSRNPRRLEVEQAAEAADLGVGARPPGRAHQRPDRLDHGVAGVDVDAGLRVGEAVTRLSHRSSAVIPGPRSGARKP
jgi:hypothetical protein